MATPILSLLQSSSSKLIKRYLSRVIKKEGCWEWSGSLNDKGYARLPNAVGRGRAILAHRLSYALHNGIDPGDMMVCHRCDNPTCTNPDHLFLGTAQDNADDMVMKGRSNKPPMPEESNPRAIVTREEARYIKLATSIRMANTELAQLFGVHHSTISAIKLGKSWPNVNISEE